MVAATGRSAAGCWGETRTAEGRQGWEGELAEMRLVYLTY